MRSISESRSSSDGSISTSESVSYGTSETMHYGISGSAEYVRQETLRQALRDNFGSETGEKLYRVLMARQGR